mgnify:CR=1 FL=1
MGWKRARVLTFATLVVGFWHPRALAHDGAEAAAAYAEQAGHSGAAQPSAGSETAPSGPSVPDDVTDKGRYTKLNNSFGEEIANFVACLSPKAFKNGLNPDVQIAEMGAVFRAWRQGLIKAGSYSAASAQPLFASTFVQKTNGFKADIAKNDSNGAYDRLVGSLNMLASVNMKAVEACGGKGNASAHSIKDYLASCQAPGAESLVEAWNSAWKGYRSSFEGTYATTRAKVCKADHRLYEDSSKRERLAVSDAETPSSETAKEPKPSTEPTASASAASSSPPAAAKPEPSAPNEVKIGTAPSPEVAKKALISAVVDLAPLGPFKLPAKLAAEAVLPAAEEAWAKRQTESPEPSGAAPPATPQPAAPQPAAQTGTPGVGGGFFDADAPPPPVAPQPAAPVPDADEVLAAKVRELAKHSRFRTDDGARGVLAPQWNWQLALDDFGFATYTDAELRDLTKDVNAAKMRSLSPAKRRQLENLVESFND